LERMANWGRKNYDHELSFWAGQREIRGRFQMGPERSVTKIPLSERGEGIGAQRPEEEKSPRRRLV